MAVDVAGDGRLMDTDDGGTLATLTAHRRDLIGSEAKQESMTDLQRFATTALEMASSLREHHACAA